MAQLRFSPRKLSRHFCPCFGKTFYHEILVLSIRFLNFGIAEDFLLHLPAPNFILDKPSKA